MDRNIRENIRIKVRLETGEVGRVQIIKNN